MDLISGKRTRENASDWAGPWFGAEDPDVTDDAVWDAVTAIRAADMPAPGGMKYLHGSADFKQWLDELEAAP